MICGGHRSKFCAKKKKGEVGGGEKHFKTFVLVCIELG